MRTIAPAPLYWQPVFGLVLAAIGLLLTPPAVSAAVTNRVDATWYFGDYTSHALNVRRVTFTPLGPSAQNVTTNLSRRPQIYSAAAYPTLTNGYITITNILTGYAYKLDFADGYGEPSVTNYFATNTFGAVDAYSNEVTYIEWRAGLAVQFYGPYFGATNLTYYINTNGTPYTNTTDLPGVVSGQGIGTNLTTYALKADATNAALGAVVNYQTNFGAFATNETLRASGGLGTKAINVFDHVGTNQFFVNDEGPHWPTVDMIYEPGTSLAGMVFPIIAPADSGRMMFTRDGSQWTNLTAASIVGTLTNRVAYATNAGMADTATTAATVTSIAGNQAQVAAIMGTNNAAGATNLYGANNNISFGLFHAPFAAGSSNNAILGADSGTINGVSKNCVLLGANGGGAIINASLVSGIICVNEGTLYGSQYSAIVGGQHMGIGGSGGTEGTFDGHNFVGGGNNIYMGDEFSTDAFFANGSLGGQQSYWVNGASNTVSLGGRYNILAGPNLGAIVSGQSNQLVGVGAVIIGGFNITNTGNHEIVLGKRGTEVRINTNGVTSFLDGSTRSITNTGNIQTATLNTTGTASVTGLLTASGNINLGGNTINNNPVWTNFLSGTSSVLSARYGSSILTFADDDEFSGGDIFSLEGNAARSFTFHIPPAGSGAGLTNVITSQTVYAAGTVYTLTGSSALLDFGTTDPSITVAVAGTYSIRGAVTLKFNAATYAAAQTATVKFRRTNNTPADLSNGSRALTLPVLTTYTGGDIVPLPEIEYTAAAGDIIQLYGVLSATPSVGSITAEAAEIIIQKIR